jgi:predicted Zn-dependent peptidase
MIHFEQHTMTNGLKVIVHSDKSTPLAAVNILYKVGARDEMPDKTGLAHLFEHFMFEGSVNIPEFDAVLQLAAGENNAFTNNDITNYYDILPAANIETAFWLESDRMLCLNFDEHSLETQKKVVMEEFKEHYINQPYGDVWHKISEMAYTVHPYRWPTIGKELSHIEKVTMDDCKQFFFHYYRPNNATLVVAGNVEAHQIFSLAEKWFGDIPRGETTVMRQYPAEPPQQKKRVQEVYAAVPVNAIYKTWKMCARTHEDYYATDLLRDLLSTGESSRLYRILVKEKKIFSSIHCYLSETIDEGLFCVEGQLNKGFSMEQAENALNEIVHQLATEKISEKELTKVKNKMESLLAFSDTNVLNRAMNLAYADMLGNPHGVNEDIEKYRSVSLDKLREVAAKIFNEEQSCVLKYFAKN